jgi:hypothetical protein
MKTGITGSVETGISSLGILILALVALAIVDVSRHDVKVVPKWVWVAAIVVLFPVGPVLYLLWGRGGRETARASN